MEGLTAARIDSLEAIVGSFGPTWGGPSVLQVVAALATVIGAIVLVAWLYRRLSLGGVPAARAATIRVVGRTHVDRRSAILLVEVDGRRVLVGMTPGSLTSLSEWEEAPEPEMTIAEAREPASTRFDGVLGRVLTKLRALEEVAT